MIRYAELKVSPSFDPDILIAMLSNSFVLWNESSLDVFGTLT